MAKVIGIDLGTTNCCVAFIDRGEPVVIPNADGNRTTPSVVAFTKNGERRVGTIARRQAATNPENTVFSVKRLMGRQLASPQVQRHAQLVPYKIVANESGDAWVSIGGKELSPQEISAMILQNMKQVAEDYIGEEVTEAVITVPAYFDDAQRAATAAAGKIAGLDVKRIINEPTAAALAYGVDKKEGQRIAVYDLGGGTFDISILEISAGVCSVKATAGDTHLGGEDLDNALVEELARRFERQHGIDLRKDRVALQRLKEEAQKAKHELSWSLDTELNLPFIASNASGPKHLVETLRRSELEILVGEIVERTLEPCQRALSDAGLRASDIDAVVLVGGQTRMPLVHRKVTEFFGRPPHKGVNPDEVVGVGAALHGAALTGEVDEVVLLEVIPLSLGVETGGGVFYPLIPRNTTIPTRVSEIFTTSVDNQSFVPIHVLQGEREMAADNKSLAKFELAPIPPAPRGVPEIEVIFDIDKNGMVHVSARDIRTGKQQSVQVVASTGLSHGQIDQLISEADQYREIDAKRRELAELKSSAESLLYTTSRTIEESRDMVPAEVIEDVERDVETLRELVHNDGDAFAIRDALLRLEASAYKITESLCSAGE